MLSAETASGKYAVKVVAATPLRSLLHGSTRRPTRESVSCSGKRRVLATRDRLLITQRDLTGAGATNATHPSGFLRIGHRRARGHAPENTLLLIEAGTRIGADMIEFDGQLCQDELVVIHNHRLERTTNGVGRVQQVRFDYLRGLDAGKGQQIPTLQEVLRLVEGRISLNVEIKSVDGTGSCIAAALREAMRDGLSADQFLVSSFHLPGLYEFKLAAPETPIAALVCGVPLGLGSLRLNSARRPSMSRKISWTADSSKTPTRAG